MKIETKFNIGDNLYFFTNKKIIKVTVGRIDIEITNYTKTEYRVDFNREDIDNLKLSCSFEWVKEDFLFKSKDEFIESI